MKKKARRKLEPEGYIGSIKIGGEIRLIDEDTYLPRHKKQALLKAERYREAGHQRWSHTPGWNLGDILQQGMQLHLGIRMLKRICLQTRHIGRQREV
jgi:hypothetical protein